MRSTFNVLFFLKKNAVKKDGTAPIVARITINGKSSQFNTKQLINENNWSVELNRVKGRTTEAKKINGVLAEIKTCLHNAYNELAREEIVVTAEIRLQKCQRTKK